MYMLIIEEGYGEVYRREAETLDECYRMAEEETGTYSGVEFQIVEIVTPICKMYKEHFVERYVQLFYESFM